MSERWRCFVAAGLPDDLRGALARAIAGWQADARTEGLRWASADGLHLTLAFLGSVDPSAVPSIASAVRRVCGAHAPLAQPAGRLGAFARPGSARVLWYAVADPGGELAALAADVADALALKPDEPYRPHVTLARARRRPVDLRGWIEVASAAAPAGLLRIEALHLMRSHLGGGPARYETLATFALGGGDA